MNIPHLPACRAVRAGFFVALAPLIFGPAFAADAAPSAPTTGAPKTHVLFMGADIALKRDAEYHRVEDVTATGLVIKSGGNRIEVPQFRGLDLRIDESLKIAGVRGRFALAKPNETYYVRVAKDGRVAAVFRDAAGKQSLQDPAFESALKTIRFKPALDAGKPVESIFPLNPGKLSPP